MTSSDPQPARRATGHTEQWEETRAHNELLKAQLMNMSLINELTRVMHSCDNLDSIIKTVLLGIQEILGFGRVILFTINRANFTLAPAYWVGLDETAASRLSISLGFSGGEITDAVFLNRHIIVNEVDPLADPFGANLGSTSYLVLPLVGKVTRKCYEVKNCSCTSCPVHGGYNPHCWSISGSGVRLHALTEDDKRRECVRCECFKCEGVFWMDGKQGGRFTSDDITALASIVNVTGLMTDNFRMFNALENANAELRQINGQLNIVNRDLQVAQARINADLEHARKIQQSLLPREIADSPAFSLWPEYIPASAVGGDYYDVFEVSPGKFGIIVADVSGHGVSSALIMSMVKILLKNFAPREHSPQRTLEQINQTFISEVRTDNFVTVFYAILDTAARSLTYTSAGHCPVLIIDKKKRSSTVVKADGLFLGVFDDMMLREAVAAYAPGGLRLVLFTDGLIECRGASGDEMFGLARVEKIALETIDAAPRAAAEAIVEGQRRFCGTGREPEDDITLLVIDA